MPEALEVHPRVLWKAFVDAGSFLLLLAFVELARQFGAQHIIFAHEDGYEATVELTGASLYAGRGDNRMLLGGFDIVYDVVGSEATLNNALCWTRGGGAVVLVGVNLHRMRLDVTPIWYQEVDLLGAVGRLREQ